MEAIQIGQRVRVSDSSLAYYRRVGIVVARGSAQDWYVRLDNDGAHPAAQFLFHAEELESVVVIAPGRP